MQSLQRAVPYTERCIRTPSGTTVVWPFVNVEKGAGPYELFLDTNALNHVQWYTQLSADFRAQCVINPWPALLEQWLSNPQFRAASTERIKDMIATLEQSGARFRDRFAEQQTLLLRKFDAALRASFSLVMPYIAIMKWLLSRKLTANETVTHLEALSKQDVPHFTSSMMVAALGALLKGKQLLKLMDDPKPAFSYLESFLAFHTEEKGEADYIDVPYLRNRAGDLNLWLSIPLLRHTGYNFIGTPAIVTGDRALHRLIVRVIAPVFQSSRAMNFCMNDNELPAPLCAEILRLVQQVQIRSSTPTLDEQRERMSNLFNLAKAFSSDEREHQALDEVFSMWWLPGLGQEINLSWGMLSQ